MATYVLVPGAWLGGWAWQDVAARLRAKGHDVYPITLTGLGERVHLARPEVDLETHIADVVNTVKWNDLNDVILAGHSYAGTVVTGVADRIPDRVDQLVYVDSAPLADGMAMTDLYPPDALAALRQTVDESGEGWLYPFPGWEYLAEDTSIAGLGEREQAVIAARATPQPWATYTQPLRLEHADAEADTLPAGAHRLRRDAGSGRGRGAADRLHGSAAVALSGIGDRTLADVLGAGRAGGDAGRIGSRSVAATRSNHPRFVQEQRPKRPGDARKVGCGAGYRNDRASPGSGIEPQGRVQTPPL